MFGFGRKEKIIEALKLHRKPGHFKGIHLTRLPKIYRESDKLFTGSEGVLARELLFLTIRGTIASNNHFFSDLDDVFVRWSEKNEDGTKNNLYVEHGWLPRTCYQLSRQGCNGRSHIKFDVSRGYLELLGGKNLLENIKDNLRSTYSVSANIDGVIDEKFILVGLQKGDDFNLKFSGTEFSTFYGQKDSDKKVAQSLIEYCESIFSGHKIIFSLHPSSTLEPDELSAKKTNIVLSRKSGIKSIDLLRSKQCACVVSINSNLLHEALVFDKPVMPIGKLLWEENPFLSIDRIDDLQYWPSRYSALADQYLAMVLANQWYLEDFKNPLILREALFKTDEREALAVRREYSSLVF